jgi:hypothetical protein
VHDDFAPPPRRPDGPPPSGVPRARPPLAGPPPQPGRGPLPAAAAGLAVLLLVAAVVWGGVVLLRPDPGPPPPTTPSGARVETIERLASATVASFRTAGAVGGPEEACTAAADRYQAADPRILDPVDRDLFIRLCVTQASVFR